MTKAGTAYEQLTQRVFQALLTQSHAPNIRVEHDVSLTGIGGVEHQVDVYWEFELGGLSHRVVVECKDKARAVDLGTVRALLGMLDDLPGQPRGVIVARNGFQEGARQLAENRGVTLYELREPVDADWDGFLRGANIYGVIQAPVLNGVQFMVKDPKTKEDLSRLGAVTVPAGGIAAGALHFRSEDGTVVTSMDVVARGLVPTTVGDPEWREHIFPEPLYMETGYPELPRILLRGVKALVGLVVVDTIQMEIRFDALVHLILKDVSKGTWEPLDAEGRPLKEGEPRPPRLAPTP